MFDEDNEDEPLHVSVWDVLAVFLNLITDISMSFVKMFNSFTNILINQANVAEFKKQFRDDVTRTIETITKGE